MRTRLILLAAVLLSLLVLGSQVASRPGIVHATVGGRPAPAPAPPSPLTTHPRMWVTAADLPRLRSWATSSNAMYESGLWAAAAQAKANMDAGHIPAEDNGGLTWSTYPCEAYAELFAFMALVAPTQAERDDYAQRARTLLMYVMNIAVQGAAQGQPFRDPYFSVGDRSRWWGEGFPLTVDWIYPYLSTADKATIRTVFLRWAQENLTVTQTSGQPAPPAGVYNDPSLVDTAYKRRWAMNNYFIAHMRQMGMMALALDDADDPSGTLHAYLRDAIQSRLYMIDTALRTDAAGGLSPEGFEYGPESFGRIMEFMWALHTAGQDDSTTWGPQVTLANHPFWAAALPALLHSSSPAPHTFASWEGPLYEAANFGDVQNTTVADFVTSLGPLGLYDAETGNTQRLQYIRWAQTNLAPGGATFLLRRAGNTISNNDQHNSIFYFLLFDPTPGAPAPVDPRPAQALTYFNAALGRILARTAWTPTATWFTYKLGWNAIDHNHGDGNQFEFYRKGEWLIKERTGWGANVGASEFHNTLALQNNPLSPPPQPDDIFDIESRRGSQFDYGSAGDPTLVHSVGPNYVYAQGDATPLYNYPNRHAADILHASRTILWLNNDYIFVYDRAQSATAGRFKRFWLSLPAAATVAGTRTTLTTASSQHLFITTLLPANAAISVAPAENIGGEPALHDPISHSLLVDAPGGPTSVRFLHVLQGADAGVAAAAVALVRSSSGTPFEGAAIAGTAVLAPVNLNPNFSSLVYTAPAGTTAHLVTGLQPNGMYSATIQNVSGGVQVSVSAGGALQADSGGVLALGAVPPTLTPTATTPGGSPTGTPTPTATRRGEITNTPTATRRGEITNTPTATRRSEITRTPTRTAQATPTACTPGSFSDVPPGSPFYSYVTDLVGRGAISGYADCTFRPGNNITRGQAAKVLVLAFQIPLVEPATARFTDVPVGSAFFAFVETAYAHNIISGYADGTFRPSNNITRGQLAKIVTLGRSWALVSPATATFRDVPTTHPFFAYIETAYRKNVISGYDCGGSCREFRPGNTATRGQGAKVIDLAIYAVDITPTGTPPTATRTATVGRTATATVSTTPAAGCSVFPADNIWNRNISAVPVHARSANYISSIGLTRGLHPDFGAGMWNGGPIGIPFVTVGGGQPFVPIHFTAYGDESDPGPYPVPTNAPIEGGAASDGDRHVLVLDQGNCTLYELYRAFPQANGSWNADSGAVYDLTSHQLRPAGWTSADAAGLPILPGLVRYDEVASGVIRHAIRFTTSQTQRAYLWPARHQAGSSTDPNLPPMGLRVRLKASVNISTYPQQVRVILQAMKDYGMFLADNGSAWYISGAPDPRWNDDDLHLLGNIHGSDFEAIDESSLMIDPNSGRSR